MYGYIRGVAQRRKCPIKVSIKVVESDKQKMFENFQTTRAESLGRQQDNAAEDTPVKPRAEDETTSGSSLPALLHKDAPTGDGWITFEEPICYLYAGKGPFVARDLMQFPVSHPDDGYIDVVIQEMVRAFQYSLF
jgi:sphingosine kinase